MSCAFEGCKSNSIRKENETESVGFHRFPKNEQIKTTWIEIIKRPNWTPRHNSRICSKHFTEDSFLPNGNTKWRRLKSDAVPSINLPQEIGVITKPLSNISIESNTSKAINILKRKNSCVESSTNTDNTEAANEKRIKILENQLQNVRNISKRRLRKINTLTKKVARLSRKNSDLYTIVMNKLKEENVELQYLAMLDSINKKDLIKRFLEKQGGNKVTREYSLEIKKFAVTLHYLSPKAYGFVREQFENVLPHPKSISAWYKGINCNPGFTTEALNTLQLRVQENLNKTIYCALAIDEMAIRKLVEWDGRSYFGYSDVGCALDSDDVPLAKEALTFMITCTEN